MEENIKFYTENQIVLSESEDSPDCLDIEFIICNFEPNLNKYRVNRDNVENWLNTLEYKPIVGKIAKIPFKNKEDFTSHQAKKIPLRDEKGNIVKDSNGKPIEITELNTDAFGTFYEVGIKEVDGEEVIYAKGKVWKRFKKAIEILQRRIANNEKIASSWEINITEKTEVEVDGKKVWDIINGYFIGHCILGYDEHTGTKVLGAYPVSEVVEIAELNENLDTQLSEAIMEDIENIKNENLKGGQEMSKIELSSLTNRDISKLVRDAVWNSKEYGWDYDIVFLYPTENRVIIHKYGETDENYIELIYSISEEGVVTFTSSKEVKMTFQPKEVTDTQVSQLSQLTTDKQNLETKVSELEGKLKDNETKLSELNKTLTEKETELSSKISSIVDLGKNISAKELELSQKDEQIKAKDTEIAELKPYKEQVDKINAEKEALELSQKKEDFKNEYLNTNLITEEDLEVSSVKEAIDNLDENAMKVYIAEKVIKENANKIKDPVVNEDTQVSQVETKLSSVNTVIDDGECAFMKAFSTK